MDSLYKTAWNSHQMPVSALGVAWKVVEDFETFFGVYCNSARRCSSSVLRLSQNRSCAVQKGHHLCVDFLDVRYVLRGAWNRLRSITEKGQRPGVGAGPLGDVLRSVMSSWSGPVLPPGTESKTWRHPTSGGQAANHFTNYPSLIIITPSTKVMTGCTRPTGGPYHNGSSPVDLVTTLPLAECSDWVHKASKRSLSIYGSPPAD